MSFIKSQWRPWTRAEAHAAGKKTAGTSYVNGITGETISRRQYRTAVREQQLGHRVSQEAFVKQAPEFKRLNAVFAASTRHARTNDILDAKTRRVVQDYLVQRHHAEAGIGKPPDLNALLRKHEVNRGQFNKRARELGALEKQGREWLIVHAITPRPDAARGFVAFVARRPDEDPARQELMLDEKTRSQVARWLMDQERYHNQRFEDVYGREWYISSRGREAARAWHLQNPDGTPVRYLGDRLAG
jgi:hypothetical protein